MGLIGEAFKLISILVNVMLSPLISIPIFVLSSLTI
jgi:hypothetical protein